MTELKPCPFCGITPHFKVKSNCLRDTSKGCGIEWRAMNGRDVVTGAELRDVPDTDVGEIANMIEFKKRMKEKSNGKTN